MVKTLDCRVTKRSLVLAPPTTWFFSSGYTQPWLKYWGEGLPLCPSEGTLSCWYSPGGLGLNTLLPSPAFIARHCGKPLRGNKNKPGFETNIRHAWLEESAASVFNGTYANFPFITSCTSPYGTSGHIPVHIEFIYARICYVRNFTP